MPQYTFNDYWRVLDDSGPKFKELILDRAAHDDGINLIDLKRLCDKAYPEQT